MTKSLALDGKKMREILFRGKCFENGEWVYGYLSSKRTISVESPIGNIDEVVIDPATVGQYTGLTDKNGVKIFEGGILSDTEILRIELCLSKETERLILALCMARRRLSHLDIIKI